MLMKLTPGDSIPLTLGRKVLTVDEMKASGQGVPYSGPPPWMAGLSDPEVQASDLKHPSAPRAVTVKINGRHIAITGATYTFSLPSSTWVR